ncbi:MAG: hypothetical protein ACREMV_06850, partial [Gemmatimonadales bacterium]
APPPERAALAVSTIQLGKQLGTDKNVVQAITVFGATDTIYAAVATTGMAPSATLTARWTYEDGQLVSESSQVIAPSGPAVTEFHIAKPSAWPTGKYRVAVTLDGVEVGTKEFEVR